MVNDMSEYRSLALADGGSAVVKSVAVPRSRRSYCGRRGLLLLAFGIAGLVVGICMVAYDSNCDDNNGDEKKDKKGLRGAPHKVAQFFHLDRSRSASSSSDSSDSSDDDEKSSKDASPSSSSSSSSSFSSGSSSDTSAGTGASSTSGTSEDTMSAETIEVEPTPSDLDEVTSTLSKNNKMEPYGMESNNNSNNNVAQTYAIENHNGPVQGSAISSSSTSAASTSSMTPKGGTDSKKESSSGNDNAVHQDQVHSEPTLVTSSEDDDNDDSAETVDTRPAPEAEEDMGGEESQEAEIMVDPKDEYVETTPIMSASMNMNVEVKGTGSSMAIKVLSSSQDSNVEEVVAVAVTQVEQESPEPLASLDDDEDGLVEIDSAEEEDLSDKDSKEAEPLAETTPVMTATVSMNIAVGAEPPRPAQAKRVEDQGN